jgi:hypothetical protein
MKNTGAVSYHDDKKLGTGIIATAHTPGIAVAILVKFGCRIFCGFSTKNPVRLKLILQ